MRNVGRGTDLVAFELVDDEWAVRGDDNLTRLRVLAQDGHDLGDARRVRFRALVAEEDESIHVATVDGLVDTRKAPASLIVSGSAQGQVSRPCLSQNRTI